MLLSVYKLMHVFDIVSKCIIVENVYRDCDKGKIFCEIDAYCVV